MYVAWILSLDFFIAVVAGHTSLPRWDCICKGLPFFIVLASFKDPGAGNIVGAIIFLGLLLLI